MSMPSHLLVRKVSRASASAFVGNMCTDVKLERSRSNVGGMPGPGVTWATNWKNDPKSAQSETTNGTRSIRISLVVSRRLAIGNDCATE